MASLVFQAFGVLGKAVEAMLTEILEMNYFFAHGIWQLKELQRKYN